MRECSNDIMRDRLPELLHERLPAAQRTEVEAHVAGCDACRSEVELLRLVRASATAPRIDTSRIIAALPTYRASAWRGITRTPFLRAAVLLFIAIGAVLVFTNRAHDDELAPHIARQPAQRDVAPAADSARRVMMPQRLATRPVTIPTELPVGDALSDLSDSELRALLAELDELEAVTPAEPDAVVVPAPTSGRT